MTRIGLLLFLVVGSLWSQTNASGTGGGTVDANAVKNAVYCPDTSGTPNTVTCTTTTLFPATYNTGQAVNVKIANTVTGATTININSLGAKSVTKNGSAALANGDLSAGGIYPMTYDGTEFVVTQNLGGSGGGGTGNAGAMVTTTIFGVISGTYTSGGTITGSATQTCTLSAFNGGGSGATATVALTGTNVIAGGTALVITAVGTGFTSAPTSATLGNGTATCSGTATISTLIGPTFVCPSATAGTEVNFVLSTTLTATIANSALSTCTTGSHLTFRAVEDATGGRTFAMPAGFEACVVNPAANVGTKCEYFWDGTNGRLLANTGDAGYGFAQTAAAPGTPPAAGCYTWFDSTDNRYHDKCNNTTTVGTTVVSSTAPANQFATSLSTAGAVGYTQPSFTNLSGTAQAGQVPLSIIAAATATGGPIASGNNPITWNWAQTTDAQDAFTFGETSAATGGTLTNLLANQGLLHLSTASASTATPFEIDQGSVTGATGPPTAQFETTWNNASLVGQGLVFNVTNTSSAAGSRILNMRAGNTSEFQVDPAGNAIATTSLQTTTTAPGCTPGTAGFYCGTEGTEFTNVASAGGFYFDANRHEAFAKTAGSATKGLMVRAQPGAVNQTGQAAAITTATLCASAPGACNVTGQYHVHWNFWGSGTACSSVTAGSVTFLLSWTDENAVAHAAVAEQMQVQTGAATTAVQASFPFQTALANESGSGDVTISTNGSIIQYATGYTACTTGTGTYNLRATVTALQ